MSGWTGLAELADQVGLEDAKEAAAMPSDPDPQVSHEELQVETKKKRHKRRRTSTSGSEGARFGPTLVSRAVVA